MRIAVYAGTFDPVTLGHLSIIERGARLFDRLWVVVAVNPNKQPLFSTAERVEMIGEVAAHLGNVSCASTEGFVVDFARQYDALLEYAAFGLHRRRPDRARTQNASSRPGGIPCSFRRPSVEVSSGRLKVGAPKGWTLPVLPAGDRDPLATARDGDSRG
jgi:cytidyltransferase-like protein